MALYRMYRLSMAGVTDACDSFATAANHATKPTTACDALAVRLQVLSRW